MNQEYPKKFRLLSREDFDNHRANSSLNKSKYFLFFTAKNLYPNSRLGLKISKKIGNAVTRNRIKRLLRECFRKSDLKNINIDFVVVPKAYMFKDDVNIIDLRKDIIKFFNKFSIS